MNIVYVQRLRMAIRLAGRDLAPPPTPAPYYFLPWEEALLDAFARAKYLSFRGEIDARVFPRLAEFDGCRRLMREITQQPGFLPGSTWLVVRAVDGAAQREYCGAVQGVQDQQGAGAIQNFGIVRSYRRRGLGTSLLLRSLEGFRRAGVHRVYLEVTAQNIPAIRLYHRLGFTVVKTLYKTVETSHASQSR